MNEVIPQDYEYPTNCFNISTVSTSGFTQYPYTEPPSEKRTGPVRLAVILKTSTFNGFRITYLNVDIGDCAFLDGTFFWARNGHGYAVQTHCGNQHDGDEVHVEL